MRRDEVINKLSEIFKDVFANDKLEITEKTNADDIEGWDSLTNINILAAVQDEFSVSFDMDEIVAMKNVKDIVDGIIGKIQ